MKYSVNENPISAELPKSPPEIPIRETIKYIFLNSFLYEHVFRNIMYSAQYCYRKICSMFTNIKRIYSKKPPQNALVTIPWPNKISGTTGFPESFPNIKNRWDSTVEPLLVDMKDNQEIKKWVSEWIKDVELAISNILLPCRLSDKEHGPEDVIYISEDTAVKTKEMKTLLNGCVYVLEKIKIQWENNRTLSDKEKEKATKCLRLLEQLGAAQQARSPENNKAIFVMSITVAHMFWLAPNPNWRVKALTLVNTMLTRLLKTPDGQLRTLPNDWIDISNCGWILKTLSIPLSKKDDLTIPKHILKLFHERYEGVNSPDDVWQQVIANFDLFELNNQPTTLTSRIGLRLLASMQSLSELCWKFPYEHHTKTESQKNEAVNKLVKILTGICAFKPKEPPIKTIGGNPPPNK